MIDTGLTVVVIITLTMLLCVLDFKQTGLGGSSGDVALVYLVYEIIWSLRDGSAEIFD